MSTVLLVGASRGIGAELARQYLADGWRVIATARDEAGLAQLRDQGAQALRLDVADPASVSSLSWLLDGESLDLAIYVAGVMDRQDTRQPPTREQFDHVMHANVLGALQVLPQIAPMLQETGGTLACISSIMGSLTLTDSGSAALYRISKAALNMVVRCAQADHPQLRIVAMHPGWVQTEMGGAQAPLTPTQSARDIRHTLAHLQPAQCGTFLNHDGSPLPW